MGRWGKLRNPKSLFRLHFPYLTSLYGDASKLFSAHSLTLSRTHSPMHSLTHALTHTVLHVFVHSLTCLLTHSCVALLAHSLTHPPSEWVNALPTHLNTHRLVNTPYHYPLTHQACAFIQLMTRQQLYKMCFAGPV